MKIYVYIQANNSLVPSSNNGIITTNNLPQISDKDLLKNYPIGDKVIYNFEKKWKTQEFIPHHSIPADTYKHLTLLHPIIELLEDHDFQYVDDSILESMVVKLKANPSLSKNYTYKDFFGINPKEYPLRYSIPINFEEYVYAITYKDGIYTLVMNRMSNTTPNPHYRKDIEHGIFAQLQSFADKLNESCNKLYNSELNKYQSVVTPIFGEMVAELVTTHNYVILNIGFKNIVQVAGRSHYETVLEQSLSYISAYHYFSKYFSPYVDTILKNSPLEVYNTMENTHPSYSGYSICAAFSLDTALMREDENDGNILTRTFLKLISKSARHLYKDDGSTASYSEFKNKVLVDTALMSTLNLFYKTAIESYHEQKKHFDAEYDKLENVIRLFNNKSGGSCKIVFYSKQTSREYRQQAELQFFNFFKFLESNERYALDPAGLLFDIAGVQHDSDGLMGLAIPHKRPIHDRISFKELGGMQGSTSKLEFLELLLSLSLDSFQTIDLGKRYNGRIYHFWGINLLVKNS